MDKKPPNNSIVIQRYGACQNCPSSTTPLIVPKSHLQALSLRANKRKREYIDGSEVLEEWLLANIDHPYPTKEERERLSKISKMTSVQVMNWFSNARRRYLKRIKSQLESEGILVKNDQTEPVPSEEMIVIIQQDSAQLSAQTAKIIQDTSNFGGSSNFLHANSAKVDEICDGNESEQPRLCTTGNCENQSQVLDLPNTYLGLELEPPRHNSPQGGHSVRLDPRLYENTITDPSLLVRLDEYPTSSVQDTKFKSPSSHNVENVNPEESSPKEGDAWQSGSSGESSSVNEKSPKDNGKMKKGSISFLLS